MARIADAFKRARVGSVTDSTAGDDPADEAIQVFASGQPAASPPWEVGTDALKHSAPDRPPKVGRQAPLPTSRPELEFHEARPVRWPSGESSEKLVVSAAVAPLAREQYSKLAAALHQAQLERGVKVVMVTSAAPQEGKTLTAVNLALTFSESYRRRVLLVDADLRHPTIHEVFGISKEPGLSDSWTLDDPIPLVHASPRLSLLPAGGGDGDPTNTLTSDRMRTLVEMARGKFDWVVLDTPPVGLLPDANLLASMTDISLVVALAEKTAYDVIQRAIEALGSDRIVGLVLNRVTDAGQRAVYPYYQHYDNAPSR